MWRHAPYPCFMLNPILEITVLVDELIGQKFPAIKHRYVFLFLWFRFNEWKRQNKKEVSVKLRAGVCRLITYVIEYVISVMGLLNLNMYPLISNRAINQTN